MVSASLEDASHVAEIATATATVVTSIVAVLALVFAKRQLQQAKVASDQSVQSSAAATASAMYCSLLQKTLEFPEFIAPDASLVDTEKETFNGSEKEFRRYEAYIDLVLTTFDTMIQFPLDQGSRTYIIKGLGEHHTYLLSDYFRQHFKDQISNKLWQLVQKGREMQGKPRRSLLKREKR